MRQHWSYIAFAIDFSFDILISLSIDKFVNNFTWIVFTIAVVILTCIAYVYAVTIGKYICIYTCDKQYQSRCKSSKSRLLLPLVLNFPLDGKTSSSFQASDIIRLYVKCDHFQDDGGKPQIAVVSRSKHYGEDTPSCYYSGIAFSHYNGGWKPQISLAVLRWWSKIPNLCRLTKQDLCQNQANQCNMTTI